MRFFQSAYPLIQLPAFQLEDGGQLKLRETRRGEPDAAPDQVGLSRRLWLDEDGRAFTVRDSFRGRLGRTSRLNALAPAELGRVAIAGTGQLITSDPGATGAAGVELREAALNLEADSRLPRAGPLTAVGWALNVQTLQADLLLPPGWRLLGTTGVDQAAGSWMSRWNLWAFFFVLVTATGVSKLFGPRWGALCLVTLIVLHGEPGAPRLVWLSLLVSRAVIIKGRAAFLAPEILMVPLSVLPPRIRIRSIDEVPISVRRYRNSAGIGANKHKWPYWGNP